MFGRTKLYQRTGSPLIQGRSRVPRRRLGLWVWLAGAVLVSAAVWAYLTYLR